MEDIIEHFLGVYLLYCTNPKYKGRTYIGFTTDPNRRIKQHNLGHSAGGAMRTSNKGPWDMVLIVHGFPNEISALRFEWAWTYPHKSRRLKEIPKKKAKESRMDYGIRVLGTMLQTKPWSRLALTLRWLKQEYYQEFPPGLDPPLHMPIAYGPVKPAKVKTVEQIGTTTTEMLCFFCEEEIETKNMMKCLSVSCNLHSHITCLAFHFLKSESSKLVPLEGTCPLCRVTLLWGNLVRQLKGCFQYEHSELADSHWTESLS